MEVSELVALYLIYRRRKIKKTRKYWIHPLNQLRPTLGEHLKLELMYFKYPVEFFKYTRLTPSQFDKLFLLIGDSIEKQDTNYRLSIPTRQRLFVTLRFVSTGDSMKTIATSFSLGRSTVATIIYHTLEMLWNLLSPIYLKPPSENEWLEIVNGYETKWNFPNCLGAIDGKHIMIQAPGNSGSLYYNYKNFHSIVLLATCDANYQFTTVDVGAYGRQSDGGIFSNSALGKSLEKGNLPIPGDRQLKNSNIFQPCTFVGDDAFALSNYMMKPYPGVLNQRSTDRRRIFNYRLSRARRIIENVFGILATRFRIYKRVILADPIHVCKIVKGTIVLHNFLRREESSLQPDERQYCPPGFVDSDDEENGAWRMEGLPQSVGSLAVSRIHNYPRSAKTIRDNLADYFMNAGKVPWQNERAAL